MPGDGDGSRSRATRAREADASTSARGLLGVLTARRSPHAVELAALTLVVLGFVASSSFVLSQPRMMQHDESVYALMARHWLEGTPDTGAADHRAPLLPALGVPVLALGGGDTALRAIGVTAGLGLVLATWWLARQIGGGLAGVGAAAVVATSPTVLDESSHYLTDVPSAALLVAMAGVLWWQLARRSAPDRRLLLIAPLAWGAYELRFGSALIVVILLATACLLWWPTIREQSRLVGATLGVLALLLVPHLVSSTLDLGTPWARVVYTSQMAGRDHLGQGLVEYVRWFPWRLAGPHAAILMAIGVVGAAAAWLRGDPDRRGLAFLVVPATADVIAIGVVSHGEPRFVLFSIALWCAAGAVLVARAVGWLGRRSPAGAWGVLAVGAALLGASFFVVSEYAAAARAQGAAQEATFRAALDVLDDVGGAECSVLTSYSPQVTWYTECRTSHFGSPPEVARDDLLTGDGWMLLREDGKRQPEGEVLAYYERRAAGPPREWTAPDALWTRLYQMP